MCLHLLFVSYGAGVASAPALCWDDALSAASTLPQCGGLGETTSGTDKLYCVLLLYLGIYGTGAPYGSTGSEMA